MKKLVPMLILFFIFAGQCIGFEGIYLSKDKNLTGQASYSEYVALNGLKKGTGSFSIINNTKKPIDLAHVKYFALDKDDSEYELEVISPITGLDIENKSRLILNPSSGAIISFSVKAIDGNPAALFVEFDGKTRVYFIEEGKADLYSTWYLRALKPIFKLFQ